MRRWPIAEAFGLNIRYQKTCCSVSRDLLTQNQMEIRLHIKGKPAVISGRSIRLGLKGETLMDQYHRYHSGESGISAHEPGCGHDPSVLRPGIFYRNARLHCINLLMTYKGGDAQHVALTAACPTIDTGEYQEKSFIRVTWPTPPGGRGYRTNCRKAAPC